MQDQIVQNFTPGDGQNDNASLDEFQQSQD